MIYASWFKGFRFPQEVILQTVFYKLRFSLSYRDVEELLCLRGVNIDHSTIQRWVNHFSPLLNTELSKRKKRVGLSWYMDETYIKVNGKWVYFYRAVDKQGQTVDFYLSENRDKKAALTFFYKAFVNNGIPEKVTIDKSGANIAALDQINEDYVNNDEITRIEKRCHKYLNNRIEQDHRFIKRRTNPMHGFKSFSSAKNTLIGLELIRMIQKQQVVHGYGLSNWQIFRSLAA